MKRASEPRPARLRVLIADDHPVVREGLKTLVASDPGMEVVAEAIDGQQAVELCAQLNPDVALIDLRMPRMNGVEALSAMRTRAPEVRGIVLTTFSGDEDVYRAFRAGAKAYLLKDSSRQDLLACIRSVNERGSYASPVALKGLTAHLDSAELSPREQDVLQLVVAGRGNKEIAASLRIAEGTVKAHVNRLLRKLGVSTRTEAVSAAVRRGLVHLEDAPPPR